MSAGRLSADRLSLPFAGRSREISILFLRLKRDCHGPTYVGPRNDNLDLSLRPRFSGGSNLFLIFSFHIHRAILNLSQRYLGLYDYWFRQRKTIVVHVFAYRRYDCSKKEKSPHPSFGVLPKIVVGIERLVLGLKLRVKKAQSLKSQGLSYLREPPQGRSRGS